jgi:tetratricopeptide (TPR) repeat protein
MSLLACLIFTAPVSVCQSAGNPVTAARAAFAEGNYPQAVKLYKQALAGEPHSAELQTALGLAYQMEGEHRQAIQSYRAALASKDVLNTRELLAIEYCRLGEYAAGLPHLKNIAAHLVESDRLLPVLAPCYLEADDPADALHLSDVMIGSQTLAPDRQLVYRGQASMAASRAFIGKLTKLPGGRAYLEYFKVARDSESTNARGGFPVAIERAPYLRDNLTVDEGLNLLPQHSDDPALLYVLGVLAGEQAMQSILDCEARFPESPWLEQFQAQMLVSQGQPKEAEAIYTRLISSHPELPDLSHELAMLYRSQGDWDKAYALFRDELAGDPTDDRAVTGISECLIQLGRYEDAIEFLKPRFAEVQAPLWAALDLSLADQKIGKYPDAIDVLRRAEKAYPQERTIHFRLMRLYTLAGQLEFAAKERLLFGTGDKP